MKKADSLLNYEILDAKISFNTKLGQHILIIKLKSRNNLTKN